jgi:hypothetical protein
MHFFFTLKTEGILRKQNLKVKSVDLLLMEKFASGSFEQYQ